MKAFLPSKTIGETFVRGKDYQIEDLAAILIRALKKSGEREIGQEVNTAVIGRPVIFSEDAEADQLAESRLRTAALKASLTNVHFQLEPIAAAMAFEASLPTGKESLVLVGDFGGGTSDFTVMRLGVSHLGADRRQDILSLGGVYVAGDAFDSDVMWEKISWHYGRGITYNVEGGQELEMPTYIMTKLRAWHLIPFLRDPKVQATLRKVKATTSEPELVERLLSMIQDNTGIELFGEVERAKCELSTHDVSRIVFDDFEEQIDRDEFNDIIAVNLGRIANCVDDVVVKSGLNPRQIDYVFITGGTSHIPRVRQLFVKRFGEDKLREQNALTSVAYGLGLSASYVF